MRCDGGKWLKKGPLLALVDTVVDIILYKCVTSSPNKEL